MAMVVEAPSHFGILVTEIEDEEDLFEIDLEAVNSIPPPRYHWGSYFTNSTGTTLLANCLLPASDVSSAIPASSAPVANKAAPTASVETMKGSRGTTPVLEPVPLGKLLQLPHSSALARYYNQSG